MTGQEMLELKDASREARIKACDPSTPQGFLRFYTYYFHDQIGYPHAQFHYDVMEALWLVIQGSQDLKREYQTKIELLQQERQREREKMIEQININIGMLRQWLNEDRITDNKKMVTNEQIKNWLINNKE